MRDKRKWDAFAPWIPESLLYVGILLMTLKVELDQTDLFAVSPLLDNLLTAGGMLILLFYALQGWPDLKDMVLCGMGYGIIGVAALRSRNFYLLITATTVLAVRNADLKKVLRLIFSWRCLLFLLNLLGSIVLFFAVERPLGRIDNPRFRFFFPGDFRFSFGYRSTSAPGCILVELLLIWCYLNFGKIKKRDAAVMLLMNTVCYTLCVSRMPYLVSLAMVLLVMFYQGRDGKKNPLLDAGAKWLVPLLSVFFMGMMMCYPHWSKFLWNLNEVLTNRPIRATAWYVYRGLTFFGKDIHGTWAPDPSGGALRTDILDNVYLSLEIWMGLVPLVLICVCFFLLAKKKGTAENVMILIWAIYSITEMDGLNCYLLFPLLLTAAALPGVREEGKTSWCPSWWKWNLPKGRKPE